MFCMQECSAFSLPSSKSDYLGAHDGLQHLNCASAWRVQADTGKKIKAVAVVHNETATGVTSDIPRIRETLDAAGCDALLMVCSLCACSLMILSCRVKQSCKGPLLNRLTLHRSCAVHHAGWERCAGWTPMHLPMVFLMRCMFLWDQVDGVSSIGALPFEMDKWGVDIAVTGSQKALSLPTGLALMAVSEKVGSSVQPSDQTQSRDTLLVAASACCQRWPMVVTNTLSWSCQCLLLVHYMFLPRNRPAPNPLPRSAGAGNAQERKAAAHVLRLGLAAGHEPKRQRAVHALHPAAVRPA